MINYTSRICNSVIVSHAGSQNNCITNSKEVFENISTNPKTKVLLWDNSTIISCSIPYGLHVNCSGIAWEEYVFKLFTHLLIPWQRQLIGLIQFEMLVNIKYNSIYRSTILMYGGEMVMICKECLSKVTVYLQKNLLIHHT